MFLSVQPAAHYLDGFKDPFGHGGERNEAASVVVSLLLGQHGGIESFKTFGFTTRLALISRNQKSEFEKREENPNINPQPHLHI